MKSEKKWVARLLIAALMAGCNGVVEEPPMQEQDSLGEVQAALEPRRNDIAWRFTGAGGANAYWRMSGTTLQESVQLSAVDDQNWKMEALGDFNNDGFTDIFWHHTNGTVSIWLMRGKQILQHVGGLPGLDPLWVARGTGDFNGDGKTDLFLWHKTSGQTTVWFMNGPSVAYGQASSTVADLRWKVAGVGDLNNDGRADVIWRHDTGTVSSWLMNGAYFVSSGPALPAVADLNWQPVGTGDLNGDGQTDLLWVYVPTNQTHVWFMNNGSFAGSANVGPAAAAGWVPVGVGNFSYAYSSTSFWWDMTQNPIRYQAPAGCSIASARTTSGAWKSSSSSPVYLCTNYLPCAESTPIRPDGITCSFDGIASDNTGSCEFVITLACNP